MATNLLGSAATVATSSKTITVHAPGAQLAARYLSFTKIDSLN
ncbi:MAG TPA: hypothetical protein VMA72_03900 [Streptosporangiaceae bacterium]|nr:hypothetical protein [Streptosporangiaceae bacterium]